jgi:uncharacterized surface protein with fasciclin (FAS1) repeats
MKKVFQISKIAILSLFTIAIASCSSGDSVTPITNPPTGPTQNIVQLAQATPSLSRLVEAVVKADLATTLSAPGTYTVFAPTNAAFDAAGISSTVISNYTPAEVAVLKQILLNHVFATVKTSTDLTTGYYKTLGKGAASATNTLSMYINNSAPTGGGSVITINGGTANGGAVVSTPNNIAATNGIVHLVTGVILPPKIVNHAVANSSFSTLVTVLTSTSGTFGNQAPVLAALGGVGPLTVFAPTNTAFTNATFITGASAATVTKVLQYHVTSAGNVLAATLTQGQIIPTLTNPVQNLTVDLASGPKLSDSTTIKANIIATDVQCANGVIHAVDKVLQPN